MSYLSPLPEPPQELHETCSCFIGRFCLDAYSASEESGIDIFPLPPQLPQIVLWTFMVPLPPQLWHLDHFSVPTNEVSPLPWQVGQVIFDIHLTICIRGLSRFIIIIKYNTCQIYYYKGGFIFIYNVFFFWYFLCSILFYRTKKLSKK